MKSTRKVGSGDLVGPGQSSRELQLLAGEGLICRSSPGNSMESEKGVRKGPEDHQLVGTKEGAKALEEKPGGSVKSKEVSNVECCKGHGQETPSIRSGN